MCNKTICNIYKSASQFLWSWKMFHSKRNTSQLEKCVTLEKIVTAKKESQLDKCLAIFLNLINCITLKICVTIRNMFYNEKKVWLEKMCHS